VRDTTVPTLPGRPPGILGNPRDPHGLLAQHGAHLVERGAREARLPPKVRAVSVLLGVLDTSALSGLSRRRHKPYQRVAHGLLHGVLGGAVEREGVDHGADLQ
jgi:hypothetical protein